MEQQLLPANTYGPNPFSPPGASFLRYSTFSASLDVLQGVKEYLNVTPYRLGLLLGMEHPGNAYQWFQGRKRPSQANCVKLLKLVCIVAFEGLRLPFIESINWATGEIKYKVGLNNQGRIRVPASKRRVTQEEGPYRVPMAEFLDQH